MSASSCCIGTCRVGEPGGGHRRLAVADRAVVGAEGARDEDAEARASRVAAGSVGGQAGVLEDAAAERDGAQPVGDSAAVITARAVIGDDAGVEIRGQLADVVAALPSLAERDEERQRDR